MKILGVVLAGGQSRRFGEDKAVTLFNGERLIDRAIVALTPQADDVIVSGRAGGIEDRPVGGLGPLAGINAALHHAREDGFAWVVSVPCDAPGLPSDLVDRLRGATPAVVIGSPVIGWWPVALAERLDDHLAQGDDRSMRGWARAVEARAVDLGPIVNINTPDDLARFSAGSAAPPRA